MLGAKGELPDAIVIKFFNAVAAAFVNRRRALFRGLEMRLDGGGLGSMAGLGILHRLTECAVDGKTARSQFVRELLLLGAEIGAGFFDAFEECQAPAYPEVRPFIHSRA